MADHDDVDWRWVAGKYRGRLHTVAAIASIAGVYLLTKWCLAKCAAWFGLRGVDLENAAMLAAAIATALMIFGKNWLEDLADKDLPRP